MVNHFHSSWSRACKTLLYPADRDLGGVEKVLVSVAKSLDEGGYPPNQASRHHRS